jgi:F0F1-type ATP synthase assembly protein I
MAQAWYNWKVRAKVFGVTIATLAVFIGAGYLIDRLLTSFPVGLIIGIVVSFPFTAMILNRVLKAQFPEDKDYLK